MATNPNALDGTLPDLQNLESYLSSLAAAKGITYKIADYGGVRSAADTVEILTYRANDYTQEGGTGSLQTWRPIAPYGESYHDYGGAFDAVPVSWPDGMTVGEAQKVLAQLAPQAGLKNGSAFHDIDHFEMPYPLATLREAFANTFGQPALDAIDQQVQQVQAHEQQINSSVVVRPGSALGGGLVTVAVVGIIALLVMLGTRKLGR